MTDNEKSPLLKTLWILLGIISGLSLGVADFLVSTQIFNSPPFGLSFTDMFFPAVIGAVIFLALTTLLFFLFRKKATHFIVPLVITGVIFYVVVFVYLASIRFYY
jgi:uncharacterized membrane protein YeaQ/YmgE (transglycosylase-associated protein family)